MKANMEDRVTGELSGATESAASSARRDGVSALSVMVVAASALVLIWNASRLTFFDDESFSLRRYILPMGKMVTALYAGIEPDPPLYYIIENAWIGLVGVSSPLLMRIPSIVFFILGLLVIRRAAATWFDESTGRVAQLLAALHPAHLLFGMAARWYSLMFLAVAVLLWMTALAAQPGRGRVVRLIGWSIAATAVVYTNYFGVAVVGLIWFAGIRTSFRGGLKCHTIGDKPDQSADAPTVIVARRAAVPRPQWHGWLFAGLAVVVAYSPWLPAFYRQLLIFPQTGGGIDAPVRAAARTVLAMTSGNLASPTAWWVHGPLAVFTIIMCVGAARSIRRTWPIVLIVVGCFISGVVSKTMLDKYVLSFSGLACVLVAAVLVGGHNPGVSRFDQRMARLAIICLAIAWLGCGVHLATGRYWSSLRWLDPFDGAAAHAVRATVGGGGSIVASHPAAAYYTARCVADSAHPNGASAGAPAESRRAHASVFKSRLTPAHQWLSDSQWPDLLSPEGASQALEQRAVASQMTPGLRRIVVIEAAEFQDDAGWAALRMQLGARYSLTERQSFLPDPDAELKDRLDPRFKHPRFRIEVLTWDLK